MRLAAQPATRPWSSPWRGAPRKCRGIGPFAVSTDTTSAQTEPGIGLPGADSENFLWVSGW
jgi:hypothetical protein